LCHSDAFLAPFIPKSIGMIPEALPTYSVNKHKQLRTASRQLLLGEVRGICKILYFIKILRNLLTLSRQSPAWVLRLVRGSVQPRISNSQIHSLSVNMPTITSNCYFSAEMFYKSIYTNVKLLKIT